MRRFPCPSCPASLFFDNHRCGACGAEIAYEPTADTFVATLDSAPCSSRLGPGACNWVAVIDSTNGHCANCQLDLVPDQSPLVEPFQSARRRTLRQLFSLGLDPAKLKPSLRFELLQSTATKTVTTGHANGVITLDVVEGDPVRLAEIQSRLGEQYRTPVGHVRHELGHWYWQALVDDHYSLLGQDGLDDFRAAFGDERLDYATALQQHYAGFDDGSWTSSFISYYASAHPWEDFAETFAHYLHINDTLETAQSFPLVGLYGTGGLATLSFDELYDQWLRLTTVLNELNRSMGAADAYPFAPAAPAIAKLRWLHHRLTDPAQ